MTHAIPASAAPVVDVSSDGRAELEARLPSPDFRIIAIGVSVDGLRALRTVLQGLPGSFDAAMLVVQHLSPRYPSLLEPLLASHSALPVSMVMKPESIQAGTVYLASPNRHLRIDDGHVTLDDGPRVHFARPSINVLFESAAAVYGSRVIGVVLSGAGSDGPAGLAAIKKAGGITIVQSPSSTSAPWLPRAAIAHTEVDYVVPLSAVAPLLVRLVRGERPERVCSDG